MLSVAEIKKFIDEDIKSDKKKKAAEGMRYYEAEHDILKCKFFYFNSDGKVVEDTVRSNIKISHPFFHVLTEQLSAYMLSFEEHPIRAKESAKGLQDYLDDYFDDEFWAEIAELIKDAYTKGFGYVYAYKNAEGRLSIQCADTMGVVDVQAKYTADKKPYKIYHYVDTDMTEKGKRTVTRIQVWDEKETHYFVKDGESGKIEKDKSVELNPRPHIVQRDKKTGERIGSGFGYIPFWRLDNNKKQFSGLKPIKALIDDYDLMQCGLSNNLVDFDTPLHVVRGFEGYSDEDLRKELQVNLKTKKMIGVSEDGGVEVKTVDIPYQARQAKASDDEKNIYIFGMGFNPAQVGDGNITNIVIKSRYTLLDLKAENLEKRLKKLLKDYLKVVIAEINAEHGTDYQMKDVKIEKFQKQTPTNDSENIANEKVQAETIQVKVNTILNVAVVIGDEKALELICEQLDLDYEELKKQVKKLQEEQNLADAKTALEGVVTGEETIVEGAEPGIDKAGQVAE